MGATFWREGGVNNNRRRALIALVAVAASPPAALGQPARPRKVGLLYFGSRDSFRVTGRHEALLQGMRELGYLENRDFVLVERYASGDGNAVRSMARELVDEKVDVVVSAGGQANSALRQATTTIPVVVTISWDPVREGLATSLARPGRNFTGLSSVLDDLFSKHVDLLRAVNPRLSRLGILVNPDNIGHPPLVKNIQAAARTNGLRVVETSARSQADFPGAFAVMARENAEALIILGDSFYVQHFAELAERAARQRIVSTYSGQEYPAAGGFMSYGPSFADNFRRAAKFVDRILRGANAADLPFEEPVKLEMVVNLRTARAMGVDVPHSILMRVDRVIE
jgi:putative ABC transport system substrate-binding protein